MHDLLLKAWKNERSESHINPLDDGFWDSIREYVQRLEQRLGNVDQSAIFAPIIRQELRNTRYMIHDIFHLRLSKLLSTVSSPATSEGWVSREQGAIQEIRTIIAKLDYMIDSIEKGDPEVPISSDTPDQPSTSSTVIATVQASVSDKETDQGSPVSKYLLVRFLAHLQSITGLDLRPYGPFQPEDLVTLPVELARPLIQRNIVVEQRKGRS